LDFLSVNLLIALFIPASMLGFAGVWFRGNIPIWLYQYFPAFFALLSLLMVLKSFSERKSPRLAWLLIVLNHFWIALAISFNEHLSWQEVAIYLSGVVPAGAAGYWILTRLRKLEGSISLNGFFGHAYEHPKLALAFLLSTLGLMAFPISPTFIGEDVIFNHIQEDQLVMAFFAAAIFIVGGISLIRIYARVFLGPHVKTYHETPYKSS
jgi:hypothetical protein